MNVIAGCRPWNRRIFEEWRPSAPPGEWVFVDTLHVLPLHAKRIFFVNWLTRVPESIWRDIECIAFHAAPLPKGRGASPIQHQILAGAESTMLTAFRMNAGMDEGPVYAQWPLSLFGSAEEIYLRTARLSHEMIGYIAEKHPFAEPQSSLVEPTTYRRRKPEESRLPLTLTLAAAFDFIRMLDCEGFPPAFVKVGNLKISLNRVTLRHNRLEANAVIEEA